MDDNTLIPFDTNGPGELYIAWLREFIVAGIWILKVGRSIDTALRINAYPKGSRILAQLPVSRMLDAENMLVGLCKTAFIQRTDIGTEYFQGSAYDVVDMASLVARRFAVTPIPVPLADVTQARARASTKRPRADVDASVDSVAPNASDTLQVASKRRTSDELATALVSAIPSISNRFRFDPHAKSVNCNGIFYCDTASSVWSNICNVDIAAVVVEAFRQQSDVIRLSCHELRCVESARGSARVVCAIAHLLNDVGFSKTLDGSHPASMFPFDNGFHSASGFREIDPGDLVSTTSGWAYDPDAAKEQRPRLDALLAQIFPHCEERKHVLHHVASIAYDEPIDKILVLQDGFDGASGITGAFVPLIKAFFGAFGKSGNKLVCTGRPSGTRLVVIDNLTSTTKIDLEKLKQLSRVGCILLANKGSCPTLAHCVDDKFSRHVFSVDARSKLGCDTTSITAILHTLRSAFADILADHRLLDVPTPQWRQDVVADVNPLAEWLAASTIITGKRSDFVLIAPLRNAFNQAQPHAKAISVNEFDRCTLSYFSDKHGTSYVPSSKDHAQRSISKVIRGVRLVENV